MVSPWISLVENSLQPETDQIALPELSTGKEIFPHELNLTTVISDEPQLSLIPISLESAAHKYCPAEAVPVNGVSLDPPPDPPLS